MRICILKVENACVRVFLCVREREYVLVCAFACVHMCGAVVFFMLFVLLASGLNFSLLIFIIYYFYYLYIFNIYNHLLYSVNSGGENFSLGERQQLCLARAMLTRPRVFCIDEVILSLTNTRTRQHKTNIHTRPRVFCIDEIILSLTCINTCTRPHKTNIHTRTVVFCIDEVILSLTCINTRTRPHKTNIHTRTVVFCVDERPLLFVMLSMHARAHVHTIQTQSVFSSTW